MRIAEAESCFCNFGRWLGEKPRWSRALRESAPSKSRGSRIDKQLFHRIILRMSPCSKKYCIKEVVAVEFAEKPCVRPSLSTQWLATSRL